MNKKKWINFLFLIVASLSIMAACSSKEDPYKAFSKEEQQLTWLGDREKSFGESDYVEISKEEALEVMKKKYQLEIPKFYEEAAKILTSELFSEQPKATILARGNELTFSTIYTEVQEEEIVLLGRIIFVYELLGNAKQVRLKRQNVKIVAVDLSKEKIPPLTKEFAGLMNFSEKTVTDGLLGYEKQLKDSWESMKGKYTSIVTNRIGLNTQEELSKAIRVSYGKTGHLEEFYVEMADLVK